MVCTLSSTSLTVWKVFSSYLSPWYIYRRYYVRVSILMLPPLKEAILEVVLCGMMGKEKFTYTLLRWTVARKIFSIHFWFFLKRYEEFSRISIVLDSWDCNCMSIGWFLFLLTINKKTEVDMNWENYTCVCRLSLPINVFRAISIILIFWSCCINKHILGLTLIVRIYFTSCLLLVSFREFSPSFSHSLGYSYL